MFPSSSSPAPSLELSNEISDGMAVASDADLGKDVTNAAVTYPWYESDEFLSKNLINPWYPYYMDMGSNHDLKEYEPLVARKFESLINVSPVAFGCPLRPKITSGQSPSLGYHWKNDPIPVEHLNFFTKKWVEEITKSSGSKKAKKFEERANEMIGCYNKYVEALCGCVIEKVFENDKFLEELAKQRSSLDARITSFRVFCFTDRTKKNYSLT